MYMLMRGKLMEKNYLNDEGSRDAREADVFEKFGEVALATVDVMSHPLHHSLVRILLGTNIEVGRRDE